MAINSFTSNPDYTGLVRFLIQPFLESPESLSIDCEMCQDRNRAWIRIAFESGDKGKVFGRGGRNIQAIRTCVSAAAQLVGQSVYLDIYGSNGGRDGLSFEEDGEERLPPPRARDRQVNGDNGGNGGNGNRPIFVKPRIRQA